MFGQIMCSSRVTVEIIFTTIASAKVAKLFMNEIVAIIMANCSQIDLEYR